MAISTYLLKPTRNHATRHYYLCYIYTPSLRLQLTKW